MTAHEHDPRAVEALAVEVEWAGWPNCGREPGCQPMLASRRIACMILSRESALVADAERLVAALERIANGTTFSAAMDAYTTLAAHRASRQPSEQTLAEAVERYLNASTWTGEALDSLRAALAREREKVKP